MTEKETRMVKTQKQTDDEAAAAAEDDARQTADRTEPKRSTEAKADKAGGLTVDVRANLSLDGGQVLQVNDEAQTVPDTLEVRDLIARGYLDLRD